MSGTQAQGSDERYTGPGFGLGAKLFFADMVIHTFRHLLVVCGHLPNVSMHNGDSTCIMVCGHLPNVSMHT